MLRCEIPDATFRLVKILKSEMRPELERAKRQTKFNCSVGDFGDRCAFGKAKVVDSDLYGIQDRWVFADSEPVMGKQLTTSFVEFDPTLLKLCKELALANAPDANGSGNKWAISVGRRCCHSGHLVRQTSVASASAVEEGPAFPVAEPLIVEHKVADLDRKLRTLPPALCTTHVVAIVWIRRCTDGPDGIRGAS